MIVDKIGISFQISLSIKVYNALSFIKSYEVTICDKIGIFKFHFIYYLNGTVELKIGVFMSI